MMNEIETQLFRDECGDAEPKLLVCTKTRIDAGRWWRPTRTWLCVMENELVMLAVSRRRYVVRVPLSDCAESHYCHATGELVIGPVEGLRVDRFRLSPREALAALSAMGIAE